MGMKAGSLRSRQVFILLKTIEPNKGASKKKLERPFSHKPNSFHMKIVRKLKVRTDFLYLEQI